MKQNLDLRWLSLMALFLLCWLPASRVGAATVLHEATLTPGWDIFSVSLRRGVVKWSVGDVDDGQRSFSAVFEIEGA